MGRAPCCDKANVKKGPWSPDEDTKLKDYIDKYGTGGNWIALPQKAGLRRCGKSCRLRWLNYLRPNIKHGDFSADEDRVICSLFVSIGSRWSIIAAQLPGRTDNDIKNYWNTKLKKKILGIPPSQRKPHHHHDHQQQQLIFQQPSLQSTPPPSQSSFYYGGLEGLPFSPDALIPQGQVSCSSSDGSLTQVKERELDMGFESYIYGGMEQAHELMIDNGGGGEAPLECSYEMLKQLASPSNGCNNSMYLDGTRAASAAKEDMSFRGPERGMYYYHYY